MLYITRNKATATFHKIVTTTNVESFSKIRKYDMLFQVRKLSGANIQQLLKISRKYHVVFTD